MSLDRFIKTGKKAALKSGHTYKVSAMLIKGGNILAIGVNQDKTDPIFAKDPRLNQGNRSDKIVWKLHAEQRCLARMDPEMTKGADLVIVRASARKGIGLARPCQMCMKLIRAAGIRKIHYTVDFGGMATERV